MKRIILKKGSMAIINFRRLDGGVSSTGIITDRDAIYDYKEVSDSTVNANRRIHYFLGKLPRYDGREIFSIEWLVNDRNEELVYY